jgi:hypothetical protein
MWASILVVVLSAELPASPAGAPADEQAPAPIGLAAGTATAIVPLIVGSALLAQDQTPRLQKAGLIVMASGFALAPWVAHGLEGSWGRAAIYGGVSLALSAAAVAAMEQSNAFDPHVGNGRRIPMKIFLPLAMVSSGFGVVMSVFDRRGLEPAPQLSLWLAPAAGGVATGLGWSASL